MPCVILEPFFIDNDHELNNAYAKQDTLTKAIAAAVHNVIF